jgi:hypothetical protein
MRQLRVVLAAALSVAVLFPVLSHAQPTTPYDHLKCYKMKDYQPANVMWKFDLTPEQTQFLKETGCLLKNKAKWFCIDVQKTNVTVVKPTPIPLPTPLPIQGQDAQDYLCYLLKCPPGVDVPLTVADQFGQRSILVKYKADHLCVPAQKVGVPTPTPTETPTPVPTPPPPCNVGSTGPQCAGDCSQLGHPGWECLFNGAICECVPPDQACMDQDPGQGVACAGLCADAQQQCLPSAVVDCACQ